MAIKFRAIHTTRPWRRAQHSSLLKATDGPDGAKNLLLRVGRVGRKWAEYGPVSCIFVWDEDQDPGYAYRLKPGSSHEIEMAVVPLYQLERYELARFCSAPDIDSFFRRITPSVSEYHPMESVPPDATKYPNVVPVTEPKALNYPDELPAYSTYPEGLVRSVLVNEYERSDVARRVCIQHYGPICQVCRVNFETCYGEIGRGFIHVHHLVPVASVGALYQVDPVNDLQPVCPNCHAMLHRNDPPFTIEELRAKLNK